MRMFRRTIRVAAVRGTEIRIDASWILAIAIVAWALADAVFPDEYDGLHRATYWAMGAASAIGLLASLVLHELGHAVAVRRYGTALNSVAVEAFGRLAIDDEPADARAEIAIGVAGIAATALIALVAVSGGAVARRAGLTSAFSGVLDYVGTINVAFFLLQVLPVFPLDGGRIVRGAFWIRKGDFHYATRATSRLGEHFSFAVMLAGGVAAATRHAIGFAVVLVGWFLWRIVSSSCRQAVEREVLRRTPVAVVMRGDAVSVPRQLTIGEAVRRYFTHDPDARFPVVDDHRFVGWVSSRDVATLDRAEWARHTVGALAKYGGGDGRVSIDSTALDAAVKMHHTGASALLVVNGDRFAGIVTASTIVRFLSRDFTDGARTSEARS